MIASFLFLASFSLLLHQNLVFGAKIRYATISITRVVPAKSVTAHVTVWMPVQVVTATAWQTSSQVSETVWKSVTAYSHAIGTMGIESEVGSCIASTSVNSRTIATSSHVVNSRTTTASNKLVNSRTISTDNTCATGIAYVTDIASCTHDNVTCATLPLNTIDTSSDIPSRLPQDPNSSESSSSSLAKGTSLTSVSASVLPHLQNFAFFQYTNPLMDAAIENILSRNTSCEGLERVIESIGEFVEMAEQRSKDSSNRNVPLNKRN